MKTIVRQEIPEDRIPDGWQRVPESFNTTIERRQGIIAARVCVDSDGTFSGWACADHPNARENGLRAECRPSSGRRFESAVRYAEESAYALAAWLWRPWK